MTSTLEKYTPYALVFLLFAGIAVLGAAVGARYSIGIITQAGCPPIQGSIIEPCQAAIAELNQGVRRLLIGGAVVLGSAIIATASYHAQDDTDPAGQPDA